MRPSIELSEETFKKLQSIAVPFVDTPELVIRRLVDEYIELCTRRSGEQLKLPEGVHGDQVRVHAKSDGSPPELKDVMVFESTRPPDVTYTTFIGGSVGSVVVGDWNQFCLAVHAEVFRKVGSVDVLRRVSTANIKPGTHFDHGFKAAKGLGFSVQAVDANRACAIAFKLAGEFGISVAAEFRWQNKDKAVFPGKVGRIEWRPNA